METLQEKEEIHQSLETRSKASMSRSSVRTSRSSASSAAIKARAKAEVARTQASFAKKEAEIMVEEATVKAKMHILQKEKDAAAASAEAAVLVAAMENLERGSKCDIDLPFKPLDPTYWTMEYVQKHSHDNSKRMSIDTGQLDSSNPTKTEVSNQDVYNHGVDSRDMYPQYALRAVDTRSQTSTIQYTPFHNPSPETQTVEPVPSPERSFLLKQPTKNLQKYEPDSCSKHTALPDVTKYLMRQEIIASGLMTFDDLPENYWAWKTSFQGVIMELALSPREELDLLIKWLGLESGQQAKRIRAIHSHNSAAGLNMVWQRLEETYGSTEAVEQFLLKRIEDFPKISNRDNVRLRELGDLLLELEYAKAGGYLPGLTYLDTSRGVNPIVEKLPFSLPRKVD